MNEYFRKIEKIRSMFKDIAITADCLAGFVGETIEEFETTYKNSRKTRIFRLKNQNRKSQRDILEKIIKRK